MLAAFATTVLKPARGREEAVVTAVFAYEKGHPRQRPLGFTNGIRFFGGMVHGNGWYWWRLKKCVCLIHDPQRRRLGTFTKFTGVKA